LVQRREVHPRKRAHLVIENLELLSSCASGRILSFDVSWASKEQKSGGIDIESCEKNSWSCILEYHACFSTKIKTKWLFLLWAATL
jgi:hypothetical protein